MSKRFRVIDLFAGPGGLAEGFASLDVDGVRPFEVALSVEKEASAHATLQLRAFIREFQGRPPRAYLDVLEGRRSMPDWSALFPEQWAAATRHALNLELGTEEATRRLEPLLAEIAKDDAIVIGGPPCQAYSLAGRSRNMGTAGYTPSQDHRHFLYREYISILRAVRPVAFVMENVKGLLSSRVDGVRILDLVLADLRAAGGAPDSYRLIAMTSSAGGSGQRPGEEFLIRAEEHGVPQARHRMIIVGVRADRAKGLDLDSILLPRAHTPPITLAQTISGLPAIRSGLSANDSFAPWREAVVEQMDIVLEAISASGVPEVRALKDAAEQLRDAFWMRCPVLPRCSSTAVTAPSRLPKDLQSWLDGSAGGRVANHEARTHMAADLGRYFFTALFGQVHGWSPKAEMYPDALAPSHRNWLSGHFSDRFRVQVGDRPSTTITSHISKDGHYFIHPDPLQCRALSVREAARLQTFPDDYLFLGGRTAQYVQVGNAVPPWLAHQIAGALHRLLSSGAEARPGSADEPASPDAELRQAAKGRA